MAENPKLSDEEPPAAAAPVVKPAAVFVPGRACWCRGPNEPCRYGDTCKNDTCWFSHRGWCKKCKLPKVPVVAPAAAAQAAEEVVEAHLAFEDGTPVQRAESGLVIIPEMTDDDHLRNMASDAFALAEEDAWADEEVDGMIDFYDGSNGWDDWYEPDDLSDEIIISQELFEIDTDETYITPYTRAQVDALLAKYRRPTDDVATLLAKYRRPTEDVAALLAKYRRPAKDVAAQLSKYRK